MGRRSDTRNMILEYAKKSFYELGYSKTTLKQIASKVNISVGSFSYHFAKKEHIASALMDNYITRLYNRIQELSDIDLTTYSIHAIASIYYYTNILNDPPTKRFYLELLQENAPHINIIDKNPFRAHMDSLSTSFMSDYNVDHHQLLKEAAHIYDLSGRTALMTLLFTDQLKDYNTVRVINTATEITGMLKGLSPFAIRESLLQAVKFNEKNDLSDIQLLK